MIDFIYLTTELSKNAFFICKLKWKFMLAIYNYILDDEIKQKAL